MKTPFQERIEKMGRRYYEVFGDLEAQNDFLKRVIFILLGFLCFALSGAFMFANRPPVVIRVSEVGKAEPIRDIAVNNAPSELEILYFAKSFTKRYAEYNAYTIARDMAEAMNQMTAKYQRTAQRQLVESGLLARVREAGLDASIEFKEEKLERDTPEYAVASLLGVRNLISYKNPDFHEASLFKAEIILKKYPRTKEIPTGLLVEEYREIILNKLEETK